jgi:hypothetical protein
MSKGLEGKKQLHVFKCKGRVGHAASNRCMQCERSVAHDYRKRRWGAIERTLRPVEAIFSERWSTATLEGAAMSTLER